MATSTSGGTATSNETTNTLPNPVDTDIETPTTLQSSEMIIDELESVQDISLRNKETEGILMPPPEIENDEIQLPPLIMRAEDSELLEVSLGEIPDSDAISNESPIKDGKSLEHAMICGEAPSTLHRVDEIPPSSLDSSYEIIANEILTIDAKDEKIEQEALLPEGANFDVTKDVSPEQANISSKAILTTPIEDAQPFNTVTKDDESNSKLSVQDISTTQGIETADMPISSSPANELAASHTSNSNCANPFPAEEPLVELDAPVINSSETISSLSKPIKDVSDIPFSSSDEAFQVSPEKKSKNLLSTKDSSSQTEIKEDNSTHGKDVKTRSASLKRPESSQNKDIMMAELKAIKIASLQSRNSALEQEISQKRAKLEETTRDLQYPAAETVKKHITLLHDYNDIRDVGQGLIGMIADNRGVRIGELYDEFGVGLKD